MADTRKDKRAPLSLKVRFKSATLDEFVEQYSYDISRGGIFIKSKKPMKVGTLLKFEFQLKDESSLIHGVGRVVWRRDPEEGGPAPGMGIKFIKMDPDSRAFVQRIVSERENAPGTFDAGEDGQPKEDDFFPAGAAKQIDPEDRTQVRHASEFLAEALSESDGAAEEAEANAAAARQRTEEIQREREAAERATRADEEAAKDRDADQAAARNDDDVDEPVEDAPETRANDEDDKTPVKTSDAPPAAKAAASKPAPKKPATPRVSEPPQADDSSGGNGMWIGLLVVAAIAGGGYFWWQGQQQQQTTENVDVEPETPEAPPEDTVLDPPDEEPPAEVAMVMVSANVGAEIWIDGEAVGNTLEEPVSIGIPTEGVEVEARARGYRPQTLSATAGAELAFELEALPWIVRVTTVPDSGRISVGGRIVGDGERSYDEAPTEPITIAATRRGYLAANRDITESDFDAGDEAMTANVTLTLQERSTRMTTRMTTAMEEDTMDTPTMDTPAMDTPTMDAPTMDTPPVMEAVMVAPPVMEAVMEAPTMEAAPPDTVPDNPF